MWPYSKYNTYKTDRKQQENNKKTRKTCDPRTITPKNNNVMHSNESQKTSAAQKTV
jgi:hypothetical protein